MAAADVFVDTSSLYALIDRNDGLHSPARRTVEAALRAGRKLVTTDYVACEAVNLANARGGSRLAVRVLDLLEQSVGIRIEWITETRFAGAKMFLRKHSDHRFSFTDCTSFVTMRELRLQAALTSDGHFREAGFEPVPGSG
jgi:uncharacterized protein